MNKPCRTKVFKMGGRWSWLCLSRPEHTRPLSGDFGPRDFRDPWSVALADARAHAFNYHATPEEVIEL